MKKTLRRLLAIAALMAISLTSFTLSAASTELTKEFCDEGVKEYLDLVDTQCKQIDKLTTATDAIEFPTILVGPRVKELREKYEMIPLNQQYRSQLVKAAKNLVHSIASFLKRADFPKESQKEWSSVKASDIKAHIDGCTTLGEAMDYCGREHTTSSTTIID